MPGGPRTASDLHFSRGRAILDARLIGRIGNCGPLVDGGEIIRQRRTRKHRRIGLQKSQECIVAAGHQSVLDDCQCLSGRIQHSAFDPQRFGQAPLAQLEHGEIGVHADCTAEPAVARLHRDGAH